MQIWLYCLLGNAHWRILPAASSLSLPQRGCTPATGNIVGWAHASGRNVGLVTLRHGCYGMKLQDRRGMTSTCDGPPCTALRHSGARSALACDSKSSTLCDDDDDSEKEMVLGFWRTTKASDGTDRMMPVRSILGQPAAVDMHRV